MILRFKTKINKNGNKRYLTIDTKEKTLNRDVNLFVLIGAGCVVLILFFTWAEVHYVDHQDKK